MMTLGGWLSQPPIRMSQPPHHISQSEPPISCLLGGSPKKTTSCVLGEEKQRVFISSDHVNLKVFAWNPHQSCQPPRCLWTPPIKIVKHSDVCEPLNKVVNPSPRRFWNKMLQARLRATKDLHEDVVFFGFHAYSCTCGLQFSNSTFGKHQKKVHGESRQQMFQPTSKLAKSRFRSRKWPIFGLSYNVEFLIPEGGQGMKNYLNSFKKP